MSGAQIALLGAIAGLTIYLGLPIGRLRNPAPRTRALLNAVATGILIFLLWDVLAHAWEPVDGALGDNHYGKALVDGIVMIAAVGVTLLGLVHFDQWVGRRARRRATAAPAKAPDPVPVSTMAGGGSGSTSSLPAAPPAPTTQARSEEHTSELQSRENLVCRLLLEKKKQKKPKIIKKHKTTTAPHPT